MPTLQSICENKTLRATLEPKGKKAKKRKPRIDARPRNKDPREAKDVLMRGTIQAVGTGGQEVASSRPWALTSAGLVGWLVWLGLAGLPGSGCAGCQIPSTHNPVAWTRLPPQTPALVAGTLPP